MEEFTILVEFFLIALCYAFVFAHSSRVRRVTLLDWSLLAIGGVYGVGGIVVFLGTQHGLNPVWEPWITPNINIFPVHTVAALLLVTGILTGWYFPLNTHHPAQAKPFYKSSNKQIKRLSLAFWIMLILAVLLQGIYTQSYGGYLGLIEYSANIRSSDFHNIPYNPWSFLQPFGGLALISSFGFFGLLLSGRLTVGIKLGLVSSFVFSLYILYSKLGRLDFVSFLATFILGFILTQNPSLLRLIALIPVIFIAMTSTAYGVSIWLNLKPANSLIEFISKELSFPFVSFFAQWANGEHFLRCFIDFILTPLYLLPSSLWTKWFDPVDQVNTTVIMGFPKGDGGVTAGIPVDLITLGLMQAHLFGVLFVGVMFGLLLRLLQGFIDRLSLQGVRGVFEAYLALKIAVLSVFYAQPNLMIQNMFSLIVGVMIILFILKLRWNIYLIRR